MNNIDTIKNAAGETLSRLADLWLSMEDTRNGGWGNMDLYGRRYFETDRSATMQGRLLYGFSALFEATGRADCREAAQRQARYLMEHFIDKENGGVWTACSYTGTPLASEKAVYENAFVLYGLTEYVLATDDEEAKSAAIAIYQGLEKARTKGHHNCSVETGYEDCYSADWRQSIIRSAGRPRAGLGIYALDNQSHVAEAYSNLYRIWPDEGLRTRIQEMARLLCEKIYQPQSVIAGQRFSGRWELLTQDENYGDDMELGWIIADLCRLTGDPECIAQGEKIAVCLTDGALLRGTDKLHGGLYDAFREGKHSTRKLWWTQCEAINGCLRAYEITGNSRYIEETEKIWKFLEMCIIQPDGHWSGAVNEDGSMDPPTSPGGMPVCMYHNVRACIRILSLAETEKR